MIVFGVVDPLAQEPHFPAPAGHAMCYAAVGWIMVLVETMMWPLTFSFIHLLPALSALSSPSLDACAVPGRRIDPALSVERDLPAHLFSPQDPPSSLYILNDRSF